MSVSSYVIDQNLFGPLTDTPSLFPETIEANRDLDPTNLLAYAKPRRTPHPASEASSTQPINLTPGCKPPTNLPADHPNKTRNFAQEQYPADQSLNPHLNDPAPGMQRSPDWASCFSLWARGFSELSLDELCGKINADSQLQTAEIVMTEGYIERGSIPHRFLILELHHNAWGPAWLRLDRRRSPEGKILKFLLASSTSPACDGARLAGDMKSLTKNATAENRQVLEARPTLGELQHSLRVMQDELQLYRLWPENCWFFVSFLQEHLGEIGQGKFVVGQLMHPTLALGIRHKVSEEIRLLYNIPAPIPKLTIYLEDLQKQLYKNEYVENALVLSRQCDQFGELRPLVMDLSRALVNLDHNVQLTPDQRLMLVSCALSAVLNLCRQDTSLHAHFRAVLLPTYAALLPQLGEGVDRRLSVWKECIQLNRELLTREPEESIDGLLRSLNGCVGALGEIGRSSHIEQADAARAEAFPLWKELVTRNRRLHVTEQGGNAEGLLESLQRFSDFLEEVQQLGPAKYREKALEEVCWVFKECADLSRRFVSRDTAGDADELSKWLTLYAGALRKMGREDMAEAAEAEVKTHRYATKSSPPVPNPPPRRASPATLLSRLRFITHPIASARANAT